MKKFFFCIYVLILLCIAFTGVCEGKLVLPASLTTIEADAFMNDISITEVVVPEGCVSIGENAFAGCKNLTKINIPDSVKNIGQNAFAGCVNVRATVETDSYALEWCEANGITCVEKLPPTPGLTYRIEDGKAIITGVSEEEIHNLVIPSVIDGYSVVGIDSLAFSYRTNITGDLVIPNSVTSISSGSFEGCSGLSGKLVIPNCVTTIGEYAFYGCCGFTGDLIIPNSVTSIGQFAFKNCSGINYICIPNSVSIIEKATFNVCNSLKRIDFPESLKSIGDSAFRGCEMLNEILIPEGVETIGEWAFAYCSSLNSITFPNSVNYIGKNVLFQTTAVCFAKLDSYAAKELGNQGKSFRIPESAYTLRCRGNDIELEKVDNDSITIDIPEGVTVIISEAFRGCKDLLEIKIPDSVHKILGSEGFYDCSKLKSIILPDELMEVNDYALSNSSSKQWSMINSSSFDLKTEKVKLIANPNTNTAETLSKKGYSFWYNDVRMIHLLNDGFVDGLLILEIDKSANDIDLPHNTIEIRSNYRSYSIPELASLVLPDNVKAIGEYGLPYNTDLYVNTNSDSAYALSKAGYSYFDLGGNSDYKITHLFNDEMESIGLEITYCKNKNIYSINFPQNVISIGDYAFQNCTNLSGKLAFPEGLIKIGSSAFWGCTRLTGSLSFPNSLITIGNSAFSKCIGLTSVTIPNSVTSIGDAAFSGCKNLSSMTISNNVTYIGQDVFRGCDDFTIYGISGSYAEQYANENSIPFIQLDEHVYNPEIYIINSEPTTTNGYTYSLPITIRIEKGINLVGETEFDEYPTVINPRLIISLPECCECNNVFNISPDDPEHTIAILDEQIYPEYSQGVYLYKLSNTFGNTDQVVATITCSKAFDIEHSRDHDISVSVISDNGFSFGPTHIPIRIRDIIDLDETNGDGYQQYRALLIGNSYSGDKTLPGRKSVDVFDSMLKTMTKTPYQITPKYDVTANQIISLIDTTFQEADADDISLFYFLGHGFESDDKVFLGALEGKDFIDDDYSPTAEGIPHSSDYLLLETLYNNLNSIPGKKIVILGSCHSGNFLNVGNDYSDFNVILSALDTQSAYFFSQRPVFETVLLAGTGWDWNDNCSTNSMPADTNGDGLISTSELYLYVKESSNRDWIELIRIALNGGQNMIFYSGGNSLVLWGR